MSTNDLQAALKSLLKKAASDAEFREKALKDPAAALKEAGVELPAGQTVKFVEKVEEVVIPLPPLEEGVADDEVLGNVAGGGSVQPHSWKLKDTDPCH